MNTKKYKGAVFFDVDGTLIDERIGVSVPTDSTKEAVALLKQNGYLTGVASGRAKCYMCDLEIDFDCFVTCNGAVAEIDGDIIHMDYIENDNLKKLVAYLDKNDFGYALETRDVCYYGEKNKDEFLGMMIRSKLSTEHFVKLESLDNLKVCKIMITFKTMEAFDKLFQEFGGEFMIAQHHDDFEADINLKGVSKAKGIQKVIEHIGVDLSDTYAFGDDSNDVQMMNTVGFGIAMTPHSPLLDGIVKKVAGGVADGGIYNALKEIGLI